MDGPASRRKFVLGIVSLGASRWPPQIVIRYVGSMSTKFRDLPLWRRAILVVLAPLVFPVSLLAVLLILTPVAIVNSNCYAVYWFRWKLTGTPVPPKAPPVI